MKKSKMRTASAWIVGIGSWLIITNLFSVVTDGLGIETYMDYGKTIVVEHRYYEEEKDGDFTLVGTAINFLALMLATRIGMAIYEKRWDGGVSKLGNITFLAWMYALIFFGIQGAIFQLLSDGVKSKWLLGAMGLLELIVLITIGFLCHSWWQKKTEQINTSSPKVAE